MNCICPPADRCSVLHVCAGRNCFNHVGERAPRHMWQVKLIHSTEFSASFPACFVIRPAIRGLCDAGMTDLGADMDALQLDALLSDDLLLRILDLLEPADLLTSAAPVCRHW